MRTVPTFRLAFVISFLFANSPLLAADDPNPEATRQYAVAYGFQSKKLFAQAIPWWAEFIKAFPQDTRVANAHYQLGICKFNEKKLPEATATFKLILATFPQFKHLSELYHVACDLDERCNLINDPRRTGIAAQLRRELDRLMNEVGINDDKMPLDEGVKQQLPDQKIR